MTGIALHRASDSDELAGALAGWNQAYTQLGRGRLQAELLHVQLKQASFIYECSNLHLREKMTPPSGQVVIGIPLHLGGEARFNGQPLERDTLLVLSGGQEFEISASSEIQMLGLEFSESLLVSLLGRVELERMADARERRSLQLPVDTAAGLRRNLNGSLEAFVQARWGPDNPAHATAAIHSALSCLLHALYTPDNAAVRRTLEQHRRLVLAAIERMEADLARPLSLLDLSRDLHTSQRTLQYSFRQICQATPQQFFLSLRLAEARRRLKQEISSITDLALDLGFASSSHFSSLYKRLYAEQPSMTLRQR